MEKLCNGVVSTDIVWLGLALKTKAFESISDISTIQLVEIFEEQFVNIVQFIRSLNYNANYQEFPTIEPYLAAKNKKYAKIFNVTPQHGLPAITHERLRPYSIFTKMMCRSRFEQFRLQKFHEYVENFEYAYRTLEKAVLKCLFTAA